MQQVFHSKTEILSKFDLFYSAFLVFSLITNPFLGITCDCFLLYYFRQETKVKNRTSWNPIVILLCVSLQVKYTIFI